MTILKFSRTPTDPSGGTLLTICIIRAEQVRQFVQNRHLEFCSTLVALGGGGQKKETR
jgi:hypothetical protein